jgi:starch-binding outer membrane protein, SusD/RagB family
LKSTTDGTAFDPRLDASIGRDGQPWFNGDVFSAGWSPTGFLTRKHQQPLSEVSKSLKGDGDLNYIYMRYADVLLMKAEAFAQTGQADSARANLNKVRQRARIVSMERRRQNCCLISLLQMQMCCLMQ